MIRKKHFAIYTKKFLMHKKRGLVLHSRIAGFTLLEIMIAIIGFSLLMVVVFTIFQKFIILKYNAQARGSMIEKSYFALEKINLLLKDYAIDYEEYFNRQNVWCSSSLTGINFRRDDVWLTGHCENFTAYGNNNTVLGSSSTGSFLLYYCSSVIWLTTPKYVARTPGVANGSWCTIGGQQSFGEYKQQFRDVKSDVDFVPGPVGDDDDYNIWQWPDAILDATGVKELYLISQDGTRRIFLRRTLVETGNFDGSGMVSDTNKFYTIEMLKLRWFDAGSNHDFNATTSSGVYDGVIDTWACDYAQWFVCDGSGIGNLAYSWFKLASGSDDGRVPLFERNLTIAEWNLLVFPTKDPDYAWKEDVVQMNPYFTIAITSKLYGGVRFKKLRMPSLEGYQLGLQTTFNIKNFYTK